MLTRIPGIGKKTVKRIVVELLDRVADAMSAICSVELKRRCSSRVISPPGRCTWC
jgi:Holliday junction resolvasome RuvABC DNA-binding subunit